MEANIMKKGKPKYLLTEAIASKIIIFCHKLIKL